MKRKAYTLIELLVTLAIPVVLALGGLVLYVAWHFISKVW